MDSLRCFEEQCSGDRSAIETVMNHFHIADIQFRGCKDISNDKIILLGEVLSKIYEVKLRSDFPTRSFTVSFHKPEDSEDLVAYEISFWQSTC